MQFKRVKNQQQKYERLADLEMGKLNGGSSDNLVTKGKKDTREELGKKPHLSLYELFIVLMPYFWPSSGSDGAFVNRLRSTSTWFMVALSKVCNLVAPFYLSTATNSMTESHFKDATKAIVMYCFLRVASSTCKELQGILYIRVKQQASIELQELTFSHVHSLSLNWHLSKKTGGVIKSMDRGVSAANQLITYLFLFLVPAVLECLSVIVLFFVQYKQWSLGLTVFIGVSLYAITTICITQWRKKFRENTNKFDNDFHDKATDSIINYETVKYFTGESFEIDRFVRSVVQFQKYTSSTQYSLSLLNIAQQVILYLTLMTVMILSGYAVTKGRMSIGQWVAVQSWVVTIFVPLNFLGSVYNAIYQAFIDIRNLSELLSESPDIVDSPSATPILLTPPEYSQYSSIDEEQENGSNRSGSSGVDVEFRDIHFHYPEQPAEKGLKGVSFTVKAGTTTAIVGHTGAGKTTISRMLFRFYDPLKGSVLINGYDIRNHTQKSVRQAIGIVPQDTVLFNETILHNVRYGNFNATFEEVVAAAEAAQIRAFIESLPEKWETVVGERGLKLSGGEKQRVAIARCLLKNPPIVLLDEATSALDTVTENSIQEALVTLGKHRTVLIIAHRLSTVRHADQIVVMDAGRIVEKGSHDELIANEKSVYFHMWSMQSLSALGSSSDVQLLSKNASFGDITEVFEETV